jgi:hypothetical protein
VLVHSPLTQPNSVAQGFPTDEARVHIHSDSSRPRLFEHEAKDVGHEQAQNASQEDHGVTSQLSDNAADD